jgi:Ser/Thr protein kinase RdoA (MazF antagonist)
MMAHFPAQYSTLSATALNSFIAQAYALSVTGSRFLLRGVSDTYVVDAADTQYIFKIYREQHRSLEEILGEIELLNILGDSGASVALPVKDTNGKQLQQFEAAEGIRYGILFYFAEGEPAFDLTDQQLITVGHQMAKVHNITSAIKLQHPRKTYTVDTTLTEPVKTLEPAFKDLPETYALLKDMANTAAQKLEALHTSAFSYGYCQYDFLPKNFHFNHAGKLTFFDFDFAGEGLLVNDLMSFFVHFFLHVHTGRLSNDEATRMFSLFVASYREVRLVSDEELKAIPYLGVGFWIFYLGFQFEHFDDWSNLFFGPKFIKDRVGLIKAWVDRYC